MIYIEMSGADIANDLLADEYANWSYQGAHLLADYLLDLSDEIGDFQYDRVAIRCDWSELSENDLFRDYGYLLDRFYPDQSEALGDLIELINHDSYCIEFESETGTRFLVQQF